MAPLGLATLPQAAASAVRQSHIGDLVEMRASDADRALLGLHGSPRVAIQPSWTKGARDGQLNLSSNELLHPEFDQFFRKFLRQYCAGSEFSRYANVELATRELEDLWEVPRGSCRLAPGADPAIKSVLEALGRSGRLVAPVPCYRAYPDYAAVLGLDFVAVDALRDDDAVFSRKMIAAAGKHSPCLVALTNPDGITGRRFGRDVMDEIANACSEMGALLLVDEAYGAFTGTDWQGSGLEWQNCVKLRTFSKSHGGAGVRLAGIVAPPLIADQIAKTRIGNGVSSFALGYLEFSIRNEMEVQRMAQDLMDWRADIEADFRRARPEWLVPTSHGNFVFIDVGCQETCSVLRGRLEAAGVRARFFQDETSFQSCVRFTVAPPDVFAPVWSCVAGVLA